MKRNINQNYFDNIDCENKAYFLGFLYADGSHILSKNRISIELAAKDKHILDTFSYLIYNENYVKSYFRKEKEYFSIHMHGKHLSSQMLKLGMIPNKTYTLEFPLWLNKNLYSHFVRGFIDGDGCIYLPKSNRQSPVTILIATRSICNYLLSYFQAELNIKPILTKAHNQDKEKICEVRIKNYRQNKIFLDWLYKDSTIYLKRKFDKYCEFLEKYNNLK